MEISGIVEKGLGQGKKLGFPTINLDPKLAPAELVHGIYVVVVEALGSRYSGAMHFGTRPTHGYSVSLEIHCIGLDQDLYGQAVSVKVKKRIRDIKKFDSEAELMEAIQNDIAEASEIA